MNVGLLEPGEEAKWEAFVSSRPQATIYHSLAWRNVTVEGLGHTPKYLRATSAAGEITGVLPLFVVGGLWGRRLVSVPMRDRAGVLADDDASTGALVSRAVALRTELRCDYLELKQFGTLPADVVAAHRLQRVEHWVTTRIDLTVGRDRLWTALDRDAVRWAINKARRSGVRVVEDSSPEGIERFYELFSRTRTRMGIPPFPPGLFRAIHRHIIMAGKGNLVLATVGDEAVNAMVSFFSGTSFLPAYAAPQRSVDKRFYPSESVFWHTIEWAVANGFTTYDFGADSPRQEGLLRFKRKWGGVPMPIPSYFQVREGKRLPEFDSSKSTFDAARRVWARLPLGLSKRLGAVVTRQLS